MSLPPIFLPSSAYMASSASLVSTNSTKPKPLGRLQAPGAMKSRDSVFSAKAQYGLGHGATASPSSHCWCNRNPCLAIWCSCSSYRVSLPQHAADICKVDIQRTGQVPSGHTSAQAWPWALGTWTALSDSRVWLVLGKQGLILVRTPVCQEQGSTSWVARPETAALCSTRSWQAHASRSSGNWR